MAGEKEIHQLRCEVVKMLGRDVKTPNDYQYLSERVFERTHERLSPTTLKRLFGYLNEMVVPSKFTLYVMSRFIGYKDFETFCNHCENGEVQSGIVEREHLSADRMYIGQKLQLTWRPDRRCVVEHLGDGRFVVVEAENTKLSVGDTFVCHLFIAHEPLFIDNLIHNGGTSTTYVAGRKDGIMFVVVKE